MKSTKLNNDNSLFPVHTYVNNTSQWIHQNKKRIRRGGKGIKKLTSIFLQEQCNFVKISLTFPGLSTLPLNFTTFQSLGIILQNKTFPHFPLLQKTCTRSSSISLDKYTHLEKDTSYAASTIISEMRECLPTRLSHTEFLCNHQTSCSRRCHRLQLCYVQYLK